MQKGNEIHPQHNFLSINYIFFHHVGYFANHLFQQEACDYFV